MKAYKLYNKDKINHDLKILSTILETMKSAGVKRQIEEFEKRTGMKRRSFYSYKNYLNGVTNGIGVSAGSNYRDETCYFCNTDENLCVHHIDVDRKNNQKSNLITLCRSCHTKIHQTLKPIKTEEWTPFQLTPNKGIKPPVKTYL